MSEPQVNQERELTRTEDAEQYEERLRELAKTMHRAGEQDDWES